MEATVQGVGKALSHRPFGTLEIPVDADRYGLLIEARDHLATQAEVRGLDLLIRHDFVHLAAINEREVVAGTWEPMLRTIHPAYRTLTPDNGLWVSATDGDGNEAAVMAIAIHDCTDHSFGARLADLSAFYENPLDIPAGEWCACDSVVANTTFGRVAQVVAGWTHPGFRRLGLLGIVHRAVKLAAWCRWRPDCFVGLKDDFLVAARVHERHGPMDLEPEPLITYRMTGVDELIRCHLMRYRPVHFHRDLEVLIAQQERAAPSYRPPIDREPIAACN
jgi:hypothetical protein